MGCGAPTVTQNQTIDSIKQTGSNVLIQGIFSDVPGLSYSLEFFQVLSLALIHVVNQ